MKPKRVYRTTPRTTAETERDRAIRAKYAQRPSLDELVASEDCGEPMKQADVFALLEVAREIKRQRTRRKMSLAALARATGIDHAALSRLENGQASNPTYRTLTRVAEALGLRLSVTLVKPAKA